MTRPFPGEALRRAIVARGWSIKEMAREAGVDRATVRAALDGHQLTLRSEGRILAAIARVPLPPDIKAAQEEIAS